MKSLSINTLGIGLLVAFGLAVQFFGVTPMLRGARQLESAREETNSLRQEMNQRVSQNIALENEVVELEREMLSHYSLTIGTDRPIIETVSELLATYALDLQNLREDIGDAARGTRIDLQVTGDYDNMIRFLHDLGRMQMPAEICNLQLGGDRLERRKCTARVQVNFFPKATLATRQPILPSSQEADKFSGTRGSGLPIVLDRGESRYVATASKGGT